MSDSSKAVFLSYASQDAEAAERIAQALRAAGVEVWFDKSELVGGDAWDAKIRRQIKACALFVPIISASTQARLEGYFRREWRMAVDRMRDMDDTLPFLVPVVIDETSDAEARVPERFRERQWTRLPGGETDEPFCNRVKSLLAGEPVGEALRPDPKIGTGSSGHKAPPTFGGGRRRVPFWVGLAIPTVLAGLYFFVVRPALDRGANDGAMASAVVPPITDERPYFIGTVAVLPPQVIAGPPESAAFADSLHEEILTQLSAMRPLDVVSRSSTLKYRDSDTSARAVGRALGADFVVAVSVQVAGAKRRITMQIIEAATDRHLAAEAFDRTAEGDESALFFQKELAWEMALGIYRNLKEERPPSPASRERLEKVVGALTAEREALQIRFWGDDGDARDLSLYDRIMELSGQVIAIDPDNGSAHTDRGSVLAHAPFVGQADFFDPSWREELLLTLKRAVALNPDNVDSQQNLGNYYLITEGRPQSSLPYLHAAVRLADAEAPYRNNWPYYLLASALHQTGQSVAALRVLERAPQDPAVDQLSYWIDPFVGARRFAEALAFLQRHAARLEAQDEGGNALRIAHLRVDIDARWSGDRSGIRAFLERLENDPHATAGMRCRYRLAAGDYEGVLREIAAVEQGRDPYAPDPVEMSLFRGLALERTGNKALAQSFYRSVLSQFSAGPQASVLLERAPGIVNGVSAFMHAGLGQEAEMREAIAAARAATDPARNFQSFLQTEYLIALAFTQAGAVSDARATIDQLLSAPSGESTGSILANVSFDSLHDAPQFQELIRRHADQLKDPKILDTYFAAPSME